MPATPQHMTTPQHVPAEELQLWANPVTGERLTLRRVGDTVTREENGNVQEVTRADVERDLLQEAAPLLQQIEDTDFYNLMHLTQYRMGLSATTPNEAAARQLWQQQGLPLTLWDELDIFLEGAPATFLNPMAGLERYTSPEELEAQDYTFTNYSLGITADGSALEVVEGDKLTRIPLPENSLLVHPPAELRQRFNALYREQMSAAYMPTGQAPSNQAWSAGQRLWHTARNLRADGWLQLTARDAEGRIWLPPQLELYRAELTADERPVLRLQPVRVRSGETLAPWDSKLRGVPYRPRGTAWPVSQGGEPMSFLAQFNLTELNADGVLPDFPREGLLQFFMGPQDPEQSRVLYYPDVTRDAAALDPSVPAAGEYDWLPEMLGEETVWQWKAIADAEAVNAMWVRAQGFEEQHPGLDAETWEAYVNGELNAQGGSRLGGHAQLLYHAETLEPGERTLFQFDDLNLGGWLGFFITQEDLEARNFERVSLVPDAF